LSSPAIETPRLRIVPDRRASLPAPLTAFIGRERSLGAVAGLIAANRLVTLTGPGGSGKTRLCIEAGRDAAPDFEDGLVWVELAALRDADLVGPTIAAALGIRPQPGRTPADAISEYLAPRRVLVILDNCERVVAEAAEFALMLLREAPRVHVLCTSRERLGVPGERTFAVPPLELPPRRPRTPDDVLGAEAVRLFMDRAAMVLPLLAVDEEAAAAIAQICIRVDGIPLAIELAAARMNVLSARQIADRLADSMSLLTTGARTLPQRQQTLRATIDWSHELLSEPERALFRRLAVFGGGFTLDAAEAVCADERLPQLQLLDVLASLIDKSLVAVREKDGEARYRLLGTVRQYAREHLGAAGESDAIHRRHAEYYCELVLGRGPALRSAERVRVLPSLDAERDNIRAALDWTRDTDGCSGMHHAMIGELWWFWVHRVLWEEGVQRAAAAIAAADERLEPARLAATCYGGGVLAWVNGMPLQSRLWIERAVALYREKRDDAGLGRALCALGPPLLDLGERETALAAVCEGLPLVRATASPWDLAMALVSSYGYVHHAGGLLADAEEAYMEADALWSAPLDEWGRSLACNSVAVIAWRRGDLDRAEAFARDSLRFSRAVADRWFASRTLQVLGYIALERGLLPHAVRLLASSEALRAEVGARLMAFEVPEWIRATERVRATLGSGYDEAWHAGVACGFDAAIEYALAADAPAVAHVAPATTAAAPVRPARAGPPPVEAALDVRALGFVEIRRNGRLLTNEEWTYAKPRELLFYLLCHPEGRTKEQIGLDLWPESPPARLRSSFHVTLHHLRRVLGAAEWVAFQEGRYLFRRIEPCAFDVERFEALLADDGDDARSSRLEAALEIYRGDFLDDAAFGDWTFEPRDRLRRRYAAAAIELAAVYEAGGRYDAAAETCRRVLARDNLEERAHRLLMQSLAAAGRTAEALRHHQVMVTLFREELDAAPSPETMRIAERLAAGG
jgi:predicted ATPase/DNA-binding SARP family transcriptional activator